MKKDTMYGYKFAKGLLGIIYKFYYTPKIIGKENIPKDGSILIVGNHVHIMDQCNPIIVTKRPVHYMAKKEYFDSWKTRWFFKSVGCIPVNRQIHDDSAKSAAMDVLNNGWALGLFPEGTRNGLKEARMKELYEYVNDNIKYSEFIKIMKPIKASQINYLEELCNNKIVSLDILKEVLLGKRDLNKYLLELVDNNTISLDDYYDNYLLPFKFGAVSMAHKSDSYLVPYGITGTYKFRSKDLTIRIGKPFKVEGDDLESANKRLRIEVLELIKENLKNTGK